MANCSEFVIISKEQHKRKVYILNLSKVNMGKNFRLNPCILEDEIVLDGIRAINQIKEQRKRPACLSGGMAVSSYLPLETHRHTIDLDFNMYWGGDMADFQYTTRPLFRFLESEGYNVTLQRKNSTWDITYSKDDKEFMIQHQRRSKNNFEKNQACFRREFENRRVISKEGLQYEVISPEDIMVRKLARMFKFSEQYSMPFPDLRPLPELKDHIEQEKQALVELPGENHREVIHLRMEHDLYDIKRLGNYVGVNETYLETAITDWTTEPGRYKSTLVRMLVEND